MTTATATTLFLSPHQAPCAPGFEGVISTANELLARADRLEAQPDRLELWRMMSAAINGARAIKAHARECTSPHSALAAVAEGNPAQYEAVQRAWGEHERLLHRLNMLVANAVATTDATDTRELRLAARACARRLLQHTADATHLVHESSLRDFGGEA